MRHLLFVLFLLSYTFSWAQTDKEKAEQTVHKNTVESHIYFLADDLLEGRATGTATNKIAASYLANQLREYGVQPNPQTGTYYQNFELVQNEAPKQLEVRLNGIEYPLAMAIEIAKVNTEGQAIYLGFGEEINFIDQNLEGKVVIVSGGTPDQQNSRSVYRNGADKKRRAMEKGAIGLIELVGIDEASWRRVNHYLGSKTEIQRDIVEVKNNDFFHIWVNTESAPISIMSGDAVDFSLVSDGKQEKRIKTQNVIGVIEGTDPKLKEQYIIYSAHYDHVGIGTPNAEGDSIYNGARDNGIGVTAVLSMAENLGKYPTKRSALFILFTGEEMGLLGSEYYVKNPVLPMNKMVYCFNTDGGGYNDTSKATIIGLERTTAESHIKKGASEFGLTAIGDPAPEQGLFDRSDNVHFAKMGVPAPTYSTGFTAFDEEITKYYHQAIDHADSLDFEYLVKFFQGYVYSGRLIANDPETPFWVSGDKYEDAGRLLYKLD